jgi:hypothetical protein
MSEMIIHELGDEPDQIICVDEQEEPKPENKTN